MAAVMVEVFRNSYLYSSGIFLTWRSGGWNKEPCPEIPDELRFITTLQELVIEGESAALQQRVREGGEDFYIVKHVPSNILD
ncbi:hypothetical protein ACSBR1_020112 [Camellia fascicularis]